MIIRVIIVTLGWVQVSFLDQSLSYVSFQLRTHDEENQKEIKLTEDTLISILRHFLILNLSPHISNDVKLNITRFISVCQSKSKEVAATIQ